MKKVTIRLYTAAELRRRFPAEFERARAKFASEQAQDPFWPREIIGCLDKLLSAAGAKRHGRDGDRVSMDNGDRANLAGRRAFAWLENALLADCRIPWKGSRRWAVAKYGAYYRPGKITPCPFTGICYDDDFIEKLRLYIKQGNTVGHSLEYLVGDAERMIESDIEYRSTAEYFIEECDANEVLFTRGGITAHACGLPTN